MKKTTKIIKLGINGEGIAYPNKHITFIPFALPKEIVSYEVIKKNEQFDQAQLVEIIQLSPDRIKPICELANICGGCQLMHLKYKKQLHYKEKGLSQALLKYANISHKIEPIIAAKKPINYRYHIKLPIQFEDGSVVAGLFMPNSNHLVKFDQCYIHTKLVNEHLNKVLNILNYYKDEVRYKRITGIAIRALDNQSQLTIVTNQDFDNDELIDELYRECDLTSLYQNIHGNEISKTFFSKEFKHLKGRKTIELNFLDYKYPLTPTSFFQLNLGQTTQIINFLQKNLNADYDLLLDIYAGCGLFGLNLKNKAENTVALELNEQAIKSANSIASKHKIKNFKAIQIDANIALSKFTKNHKNVLAVVDPPRTGLGQNLTESLCKNPVKTLVYISCNPSTLAKNLNELKEQYTIKTIQPIDMFCQTSQIETIVIMESKNV